ncbi:hypothetical protein BDE40_3033 [Litoreibacter halocynthiae]|uniref:Uncharacterized protein n=1 Tax=Litoreibacter halocynthiae TaxID=1242689 RepID=A0A4V6Q391_9RHOB|nr:hypothetical protein BDE40_3033 [Litoreibacter halocynthiae]
MEKSNYSQFIDVLKADGWVGDARGCFRKGEWSVIFDTSSCMELYTRANRRLFDVLVPTSMHTAWTMNLITHLFTADDHLQKVSKQLPKN